MTTLPAGSTFAGYVIDAVIARGGMGVVYRATQRQPHRQIALKLIAPEHAADASYRERFLREADLLASLEHCPSIVPIYASGEFEGQLYLAMRYMDGPDLGRRLEADGPLSLARTVDILTPVAAALDAAHESGLVHRDVKPANILFDSRGRVYLTDFGMTKRAASDTGLTRPGQAVGTVGYMAPEQFSGRPGDPSMAPRIDVYALGCVLHACLTGTEPYPRESYEQALFAHVYEPPPTVTTVRPDLPPEVDDILAQALAKDPAERFAAAGDVVSALAAVVSKAGPYPPEPAVDPGIGAAASGAGDADVVPPPPTERRRIEQGQPSGGPAPSEPPAASTGTTGAGTTTPDATTDRSGQDTMVVMGGGGGLAVTPSGTAGSGAQPPSRSVLWLALAGVALLLGLGAVVLGSGVFTSPRPSASSAATVSGSPRASTTPTATATTPATATPEVTVGPTATPEGPSSSGGRFGTASDVATLLALVPADIRPSCESREVITDALASVRCEKGADLVWYENYADIETLRASYEGFRSFYDVASDTAGCSDGKPGERGWSYGGDPASTIRGRYICAVTDDGYGRFDVTFEGPLVLMSTLDSGGDLLRLFNLWETASLDPVTS